jgi:hypothetical protein
MSETTDDLAAALAKAQGAMTNAPLNKTNPHFKSKYADLAAIRDATIPALSANGLALTQTTKITESGLILLTTLRHISGQFVESEWPIVISKPQEMGSALTYGKRYSWAAMCGISAEDDDDGNEAQKAPPARAPQKPVQRPSEAKADVFGLEPIKAVSIPVPNLGPDVKPAWTKWCQEFRMRVSLASADELDAWLLQNAPQLDGLKAFKPEWHTKMMADVDEFRRKLDAEVELMEREAAE